MRRERLRQRVGVLGERNFRRFYVGYATSLLGSSMSTVAIAWAVLDSGARATGLGFVFAANVVAQVVLLPVAGAIADRLGRRRVMLAADLLRCGAQAAMAAALFAGRPPLWLFVLLAWLGGTGTAFFTPALGALTVEIAPPDQLGNANALYGLAGSAARIAVVAGLGCLGRRPQRPMVVATIGTFCYALPDIPMALHAAAPWVAAAAFCCGAGSALFGTCCGTATQQQVPPDRLARVESLTLFPAYGIGVIGYAIDGPLAAALGTTAVFGIGAVYGLLSSAVVLALPDVRAVRWRDRAPEQAPGPAGPGRGRRGQCFRAADRRAAKAASRPTTVMITAIGST